MLQEKRSLSPIFCWSGRPTRHLMCQNEVVAVRAEMEKTIGKEIDRVLADAGYRGHSPESHRFRVFTSEFGLPPHFGIER